jgi:hypothetical protein
VGIGYLTTKTKYDRQITQINRQKNQSFGVFGFKLREWMAIIASLKSLWRSDVATNTTDADPGGSQHSRSLFLSEWIYLAIVSVLLLFAGVDVIVTHQAGVRASMGGGQVTLGPVSSWITGLSLLAVGLGMLPLAYFAAKRARIKASASGAIERVHSIDVLFSITVLIALLTWGFLVRSLPGQSSVVFAAVMATVFVLYKIIRLILEYRSGISVPFGRTRLTGPDYDRAARPGAFWWAMGIEVLVLLLATALAVVLWVMIASQ